MTTPREPLHVISGPAPVGGSRGGPPPDFDDGPVTTSDTKVIPFVPPGHWYCHPCRALVEAAGVAAAMDHLRLIHPDAYGDGMEKWPDGTPVVDVSDTLTPEDFS